LSDAGLRDEDEALYLLRRDIEAIERELDRLWPLWRHLDDVRSDVVVSMAFNLGVAGFMAFKKTRQYLVEGRYEAASQEMLRSKWAGQVGRRAKELSTMMATGQRKK
tara:strand:+ start:427 stop:747 length:321 start_codon:yes stop_codon:yes gene_type:complete